jgi:hypothetical protein
MNSGGGRPVVNGQQSPAPIVIMSMATQWRGHLLGWTFVSNDTEVFNETTKSLVKFGNSGTTGLAALRSRRLAARG